MVISCLNSRMRLKITKFKQLKESFFIKFFWIKHYWKFIFAHKPLCSRFHKEVLNIGKIYICRSCFLAYLGMVLSIPFFLFSPLPYLLEIYVAILMVTLILSYPSHYKKLHRSIRDVLRFYMGILLSCTAYLIMSQHIIIGLLGAVILFIFWKYYLFVRKSRKLNACNNCSELDQNKICSGFEKQAASIRKFEKEASEWKISTGYIPNIRE